MYLLLKFSSCGLECDFICSVYTTRSTVLYERNLWALSVLRHLDNHVANVLLRREMLVRPHSLLEVEYFVHNRLDLVRGDQTVEVLEPI